MLTDCEIRAALPGLPLRIGAPMREHTVFRIGGPADLLARPRDAAELKTLRRLAAEQGMPVFVMGGGANLLVSDAGVRGLVIQTHPGLARVERHGACEILAESGAPLSRVASEAAGWGLSGLAFAHGIPGTVGGALTMNAGAYGGEISQAVTEALCLGPDGDERVLTNTGLAFSYRGSLFIQNPALTALSAIFRLTPGDPGAIRREMARLAEKRRASQPLEYPSAGSVFKRPPGGFAGPLIEGCGLKGYAVGGAQVSEKHAGFIVNRGGATCGDVKRLILHIQETVLKRTGVVLDCELRFVGD